MNTVQNRIKILINSMGCSQKDFSQVTGVDRAIICRILKGSDPTVQTLKKIADATNTSPNWLLGYGTDNDIERM